MGVYLITAHAYRSWNADNPRGYVQRGTRGVQPSNKPLGKRRDERAKHPPVRFSRTQQQLIITTAAEASERRGWRLHAVGTTPTHYHLLVSWRSGDAAKAMAMFKRIIGMRLSQVAGVTGRPWHSRGGEPPKRIGGRERFDHLVEVYLPKHVKEDGVFWKEGVALP